MELTDMVSDLINIVSKLETRICALEAALESKVRKMDLNTAIARFVLERWQAQKIPVEMRTLSARFGTSLARRGQNLTDLVATCCNDNMLAVGELPTGGRRVIPITAITELSLDEKLRWGFASAAEREAFEVSKIKTELGLK